MRLSLLMILAFVLAACAGTGTTPQPTAVVPVLDPTAAAPTAIAPTAVATPASLLPPAATATLAATRVPPTATVAPVATTVTITTMMADFSFNPSELTVHVGERVRLELKNQGSFPHNFSIGALDVNGPLLYSGQSGQLEFVAERPETYEFDCLVTEPSSHLDAGMKGTLKIVGPP